MSRALVISEKAIIGTIVFDERKHPIRIDRLHIPKDGILRTETMTKTEKNILQRLSHLIVKPKFPIR